jgi:diguanylate cyclase (GGDEF)-like protein
MLLDVDMPVMDGLTTLREMKADPALRSLPVLFLTARTGGTDAAAGLGLGAQDYLRKPCEPAELRARVDTALRVKAQQDVLLRHTRVLDELSATDALTGLGNRRRFATFVGQIAAARGADAVVAAAMIDVDHFKRVNDEHGHAVGDVVLRGVAERVRRAVGVGGEHDVLVRWGGEEFVALALDRAEADDVIAWAETLRAAIAATPFAIGQDRTLAVTVSVGCAVGPIGDIDAVTARADEALYAAKNAGRNRVELCG